VDIEELFNRIKSVVNVVYLNSRKATPVLLRIGEVLTLFYEWGAAVA
jgi:hypothetical protein